MRENELIEQEQDKIIFRLKYKADSEIEKTITFTDEKITKLSNLIKEKYPMIPSVDEEVLKIWLENPDLDILNNLTD